MSGRLRRLMRRGSPAVRAEDGLEAEHCDLCAAPIPTAHGHLLDLSSGGLRCACQACAMVLDRAAGAGGHYRRIPDRYRELADLAHDDGRWTELRIPVALAFLVRTGAVGGVAIFPGALGPTDAAIEAKEWTALAADYPQIAAMERDVEAVLVNRVRGARECWIVPIDVCYRLIALVRTSWKGLNGGQEVWHEIGDFFAGIRARAEPGVRSELREVAP